MATYVIIDEGIGKNTMYSSGGLFYSAAENVGTKVVIPTLGPLAQTAKANIINISSPSSNAILDINGHTSPKRTFSSQTGIATSNVKVLLHFDELVDGQPIEETGKIVKRWTAGGSLNPIDASELKSGKFGLAYEQPDGEPIKWMDETPGDNYGYLPVGNTDLVFGAGDFTIHCWLYSPSGPTMGAHRLMISADGWQFWVYQYYKEIRFSYWYTMANTVNRSSGTITYPYDAFTHFAVIRSGGNLYQAVNGVLVKTHSIGSEAIYPKLGHLDISHYYDDEVYSGVRIDELVIVKGEALWTSFPFTPPSSPSTAFGTPIVSTTEIAPVDPEPLAINAPFAVGGGDFAFEIDVKLHYLYEWITYYDGTPNTQLQYYGIVGQFEQDAEGNKVAGGDYWSLYLRVNADQTVDAIFEVYVDGEIVTQLVHSVDITWGELSGLSRANEDTEYLHLAVSRKDDVARLFAGGTYSDEASATGALVDFTEVAGDIQINGPSGKDDTLQYVSPVSVKSFRMHDEAFYWEDYTWEAWDAATGIAVYPRVGVNIMTGKPGDIRVISGLGI